MHTHFTMTGERQGKWFSIEDCETCERPVEAANAVTHHHSKRSMLSKGFRFYDEAEQGYLHDMYFNEDIDACDCTRSDCHTHLSKGD